MSTAMMSAPSCAMRMAWARPCPRAAPVMNATLPSSRPAICPPCCTSSPLCRCVGVSETAAVGRGHLVAAGGVADEDVHAAHRRLLLSPVATVGLGDQSHLGPEVDRRRAVLGV